MGETGKPLSFCSCYLFQLTAVFTNTPNPCHCLPSNLNFSCCGAGEKTGVLKLCHSFCCLGGCLVGAFQGAVSSAVGFQPAAKRPQSLLSRVVANSTGWTQLLNHEHLICSNLSVVRTTDRRYCWRYCWKVLMWTRYVEDASHIP